MILIYIIIIIIFLVCKFNNTNKKQVFYSINDYPELKLFEINWKRIRKEIPKFDKAKVRIVKKSDEYNNENGDKFMNSLNGKSQWLKGYWDDVDWFFFPLIYNGKPFGDAERVCPYTIDLCNKMPFLQIAAFSVLLPNTNMKAHTDDIGKKFNSLAVNLSLDADNGSLFVYDGSDFQEVKHKNGKLVVFDGSNKHFATNDSNKIRIIFFCHIKTDVISCKKVDNDKFTINRNLEKGIFFANHNNKPIILNVFDNRLAEIKSNEEKMTLYNVKKIKEIN